MSKDPVKRLNAHNSGKVRSTKAKRPFEIVLHEEFEDIKSARNREKYYKTGFGKKVWMKKINIGLGFPASFLPQEGQAGNQGRSHIQNL